MAAQGACAAVHAAHHVDDFDSLSGSHGYDADYDGHARHHKRGSEASSLKQMIGEVVKRMSQEEASPEEAAGILFQESASNKGHLRKTGRTDTCRDIDDVLKGEEKNIFKRFFNSGRFDVIICPVILLNVFLMGVEIDNSGEENNELWLIINSLWNIIWFFEAALKLYCLGAAYFEYGFNRFDFFLLWTAAIDTWVLPFIPGKIGKTLAEWALTVRMLRILRLVRFVRMFENLWLIMDGFLRALVPLGWTVLLMLMINFACSVYMAYAVGHRCKLDFPEWAECEDYFGSVARTMFSMLEVTTLDGWSENIARPIVQQKPYLILFFVFWLMLCVFGILNIIVGIIVESTLESKKDVEKERIKKKLHAKVETIRNVFASADNDGSGGIDYSEFQKGLQDPNLCGLFSSLGLDCEENSKTIFDMLDEDNSGVITIQQFVDGILKFKNPPTRLDVYSLNLNANLHLESSLRGTTTAVSDEGAKEGITAAKASEQGSANAAPSTLPTIMELDSDGGNQASAVLQGLELAQRGLEDAQIVQQKVLENIHKAMTWWLQGEGAEIRKSFTPVNPSINLLSEEGTNLLSPSANPKQQEEEDVQPITASMNIAGAVPKAKPGAKKKPKAKANQKNNSGTKSTETATAAESVETGGMDVDSSTKSSETAIAAESVETGETVGENKENL